jgi:hypothetical protein
MWEGVDAVEEKTMSHEPLVDEREEEGKGQREGEGEGWGGTYGSVSRTP